MFLSCCESQFVGMRGKKLRVQQAHPVKIACLGQREDSLHKESTLFPVVPTTLCTVCKQGGNCPCLKELTMKEVEKEIKSVRLLSLVLTGCFFFCVLGMRLFPADVILQHWRLFL